MNKLRVRILFEQNGVAQISGLIIAVIFVFLFRAKAPPHFLEVWSGLILTLMGARLLLLNHFKKYHIKFGRDFDPIKWERIFASLTFCSGVTWGIGVYFGAPPGDLYSDTLMGYILAGLTAGAAVAYSASLLATYCFFLPAAIPFVLKLALQGDEAHWAMAVMMLGYTCVFMKLTHKFNDYALKSIDLGFQKEKLINKMRMMQSSVSSSAQMVALGRMASGMAHEINSPLTAIKLAGDNVLNLIGTNVSEASKNEITKLLDSVGRATERISKIINQLRSFSGRPGDEEFNIVPVKKVIEMAAGFCREKFKNNGIDFEITDIDESVTVECRPFHLSQVFLNLLNNSFDAISSKKEKWVRLEAVDMGEKIEISVTDSGSGIPEDIRSKIMQPFFTTKEVGKGMGLGLSVSKGIIDSHKGELWLDSGWPNTRFVTSIPKTVPISHQNAS